MPESIIQDRLFGEPQTEHGTLSIENKRLYPFVRSVQAITDEAKVRYVDEENELSVTAVDPANVTMVHATLQDIEMNVDSFVTALDIDGFYRVLQNKPRSLELTVDFNRPKTIITSSNEYANGQEWTFHEPVGALDPDMVRQEPDPIKGETSVSVDLSANAMYEFIENSLIEDIKFEGYNDELAILGDNEDTTDGIATVSVDTEIPESLYTRDYFRNIFRSLHDLGVGEVTCRWAEFYPMFFEFEVNDLVCEYAVAPRIKAEP